MHNNTNPEIDSNRLDDIFSKHSKNSTSKNEKTPNESKHHIPKNNIQSDSQDEAQFIKIMNQKAKAMQKTDIKQASSIKRIPDPQPMNLSIKQQHKVSYQPQPKKIKQFFLHQLPQQIIFYLTDVHQFQQNKLFITGLMQNGQTFNIVDNDTQRQLYFAFRKEEFQSQELSQQYLEKGVKEITKKLKQNKINQFYSELVEKQYVFELENVCRSKRPYLKVRYPFKNQQLPQPDWEGDYFKYVFGTTYTPLELFILNTNIKGPCWVKIQKQHLKQNKRNVQGGVCADIDFAQNISVVKDKSKPPTLRVMSISLKGIIPAQVSKKSLFPTSRIDQNHIYCISYTYCDQYMIELKPSKYSSYQKTFYLKDFGKLNQKNFIQCQDQKQMIARFLSDVYFYDPDVLACHDSARILDMLIQRMIQFNDKNDKPRIGRLVNHQNISSTNQMSRINSTIAGRLLVDTFVHSKDMIKSIDYELQSMSKFIKPQKHFKGMSDQQIKNFLQQGKTFFVLKKVRDQAQITFSLMNHLEVLQLSRNLSVICGNLWKRSLENQRAQRNEYLIMHQCIRRDLIIPDKFKNFKNQQQSQQVDRKKYAGGMVFEPKKGMYHDFIILLDFNSLYPSIIRQYNICFSKLERPKMPLSKYYKAKKNKKIQDKTTKMQQEKTLNKQNYDDNVDISPPAKQLCIKQNWGFLPHLIDGIVNQRKKCKKAMKNATPQKCIILDIQQKSYKIVANSIYGCLGFSISRFYSKPMAALITRMGRQALQRANDIVNARGGVQVIYGDTDSLMIQPTSLNKQTDTQKIIQIKNIADELKKSINKQYENLQIDIDGIFKPIILLMKKKYVANKLTNFEKIITGLETQPKFNLQFKGIEVVRRDGCEVARQSLKNILELLMNSKKSQPYEVYQQIYEYAKKFNKSLPQKSHKDFMFSRQLNKKIQLYHNAQTLPHVKVAKDRIKNGQRQQTLINHTIYYLVTKPKLQSQDTLAKCCVDDRTYQKSQKQLNNQNKLQIDYEYYKQQILQPWMRIFIHLEQFDIDKLFQSFQVKDADRKKIKKNLKNQKEQVQNGLQQFLTNDMKEKSQKFNQQMGEYTCPNCKNTMKFSQKGQINIRCGYCPLDNSKQIISIISNKISTFLKQRISKYYSNKFKCECQKVHPLTFITRCCRAQHEKKTIIPFEIHTFVYLAKQLIQMTLSRQALSNQNTKRLERLQKINSNILEKFLKQSDFENLQGVFNGFRI